jgi:hypothetical protein
MAFYRNAESGNAPGTQGNLKPNTPIHPHDHKGWGNKMVLPPVNYFSAQYRQPPQTGFNSTALISGQQQVEYCLQNPGFTTKLCIELQIQINPSAAAPVQVLPHYLFDRIEFYDQGGSVLQTTWGDEIYLDKINQTLEQNNRVLNIENITSGYNAQTALAAGTVKTFLIHIPCFIDGISPMLSSIRNGLRFRVFYSANGVQSGAATDLWVTSADCIAYGQQVPGFLENREIANRENKCLYYRVLNSVRAAQQVVAMNPSSQYDIRLTSATGMSAFLVFVVRAAALTPATINTFVQILSFDLRDSSNTIVGINTTQDLSTEISLLFQGDIFNYKNIYVVPFALSPQMAMAGNQVGFYQFSGNELLRIYTPSTLTAGNYEVDVFSFEYNVVSIEKGALMISK